MSLSDTITTYKKLSTSYILTGKVMVDSTLKVTDRKYNTTPYIEIYPTSFGNTKVGAISTAMPLGVVVFGKSKNTEVTIRAPLGHIPYYIKEIP